MSQLFRRRPRSAGKGNKTKDKGKLVQAQDQPTAAVVATAGGRAPVTGGGAAPERIGAPGAAAQHAGIPGIATFGIFNIAVWIRPVPILAPLKDVAVHVVQTPGVRRKA